MLNVIVTDQLYTLQCYVSETQNKWKNRSVPERRESSCYYVIWPKWREKGEEKRERKWEEKERGKRKKFRERKKPKGWRGTAEVWFEPVPSCHGHATFHPNVAAYKEIDLTTIMHEYLCAFDERNYPKCIYTHCWIVRVYTRAQEGEKKRKKNIEKNTRVFTIISTVCSSNFNLSLSRRWCRYGSTR